MDLAGYFSLRTQMAVLGGAGAVFKKELKLYAGVAMGTMARPIYDALINSTPIGWPIVGAGLIASVIVFPAVYANGGMNRGSLTLAKWCVAFQNGFFWQALMETISSSHRAG